MIERVWNWLKDHPDKTATHIADSMKEPHQRVSATLNVLRQRQMVVSRHNAKGPLEWSVTQGLKAYELLPKVKAVGPEQKKPKAAGLAYEQKVKTPEELAEELLESVSLDTAFHLYRRLKTYFEPKVL